MQIDYSYLTGHKFSYVHDQFIIDYYFLMDIVLQWFTKSLIRNLFLFIKGREKNCPFLFLNEKNFTFQS